MRISRSVGKALVPTLIAVLAVMLMVQTSLGSTTGRPATRGDTLLGVFRGSQASVQGTCPAVQNTPSLTIVYGSVTLDGTPAPVGTVVEARSPRGDIVGCQALQSVGVLPLMQVYGEDNEPPPIPGMRDGEVIAFYVNGNLARATSTWDLKWHDDKAYHEITLDGTTPHWGEIWPGSGVGLVLNSSDNVALKAISAALTGARFGVHATALSSAGRGVFGYAGATSGKASGVQGESRATAGRGVYGYANAASGTTFGVYGKSRSTAGRGVYGLATATRGATFGVYGAVRSSSGRAVFGNASARSGQNYGVYGESASNRGRGVYGYANAAAGTTTGVYGSVRSRDGWAAAFVSTKGNGLYISVPSGKMGLNVVKGTKNAVVPTSDGARLLYTEEATAVWFSDYGFGRLQGREAAIVLDPTFSETVNLTQRYYVFLQPYGDAELYVSEWASTYFVVRSRGGDPDAAFGYRIVAKRKGLENFRLERAPWADDDPNLSPASARPSVSEEVSDDDPDLMPLDETSDETVSSDDAEALAAQPEPEAVTRPTVSEGGAGDTLGNLATGHTHFGEKWFGNGVGLTLTSSDGTALQASSNALSGARFGVYGTSRSSSGGGVCGVASAAIGPASGVYAAARSTRARAVYGYANAPAGATTGLYGQSDSTRGRGVYGYATATSGVTYGAYGVSRSSSGRGAYGLATSTTGLTYGVYGASRSSSGRAVYGYAAAASGATYGVYGEVRSPKGWAGRFISKYGNGVYISVPSGKMGLNVVSGTKNAGVRTSDGAQLLYAEEATEVWFADYGFGQLAGGEAVVQIDPVYAETVNLAEAYHVFLQAYGDADLYVAERGDNYFVVRARTGDPKARFVYRIVAKRLGHEGRRLERAPWADEDPNLDDVVEPELEPRVFEEDSLGDSESTEPAESAPVLEKAPDTDPALLGSSRDAVGDGAQELAVPVATSATHDHWGERWSGSGRGLRIVSSDDTALKGISRATAGPTCGVYGESRSTGGRGIFAYAGATTGITYGAYGVSRSPEGRGVSGRATATTGVTYGTYGRVRSTRGRAVHGYATATSGVTAGVYGESHSVSGRGIYGYAMARSGLTYGVMGISRSTRGIGVYGVASATSGATIGVYGNVRSPRGWAGRFISKYGNGVYISVPSRKRGLNVVSGTKNAVVWTSDGARLLYAEESTEVWFADYGFGQLRGKDVTVSIDPVFAETVNLREAYHVFLQTYGGADLYVAERTPTYFIVRSRSGDANVGFGYRIAAKRLGHEGRRLERAPWADKDPNLGAGPSSASVLSSERTSGK